MVTRSLDRRTGRGFTLIELLVVLAVLALLMTIAAPRYIDHVERAREATLRTSLRVMREAIDKFDADQGRLPASLDELVERRYLKEVPPDPITERRDSWVLLSPADLPPRGLGSAATDDAAARSAAAGDSNAATAGALADVRSGAEGVGRDGIAFKAW
jgi:prepilin-type N-terminal cleavage/methylation domain-containing protein